MRRISSLLSAVAVLGLGSAASAADLPYKVPPPVIVVAGWSGV